MEFVKLRTFIRNQQIRREGERFLSRFFRTPFRGVARGEVDPGEVLGACVLCDAGLSATAATAMCRREEAGVIERERRWGAGVLTTDN